MKESIVIVFCFFASASCTAQWLDVGLGNPGFPSAVSANVIAFGVHDTTLFVSSSDIGGRILRFVPPNGWVRADSGIDYTKGLIYLYASLGRFLFGSPGTARQNLTTDNGAHWNPINVGGPPYCNGTYLFGGLGSSIARSSDSGVTWVRSATLSVNMFSSLGTYIFASAPNTIWRSTDAGLNWMATAAPFGNVKFAPMGGVLFAFNGSIIRTTDSGVTWVQTSVPRTNTYSIVAKNPYLFAGTDSGVYVSLDSGARWRNVSKGLYTTNPNHPPVVQSMGVFDTMLFVGIDAYNGYGYCTARSIRDIVREAKSGVQRVASVPENDSLEIFPNPASGLVTIRFGSTAIEHVTVLNVLGSEMLNVPSVRENELTLDLSHFASGTYFLRIETAKEIVMRKVVRE